MNNENKITKEEMLRKVKKITCIVLFVLFGLVIVINTVMLGSALFSPNHLPSFFGKTPAIVYADTMEGESEDSVAAGSFILTDGSDITEAQTGDVIAYYYDGFVRVARVTSAGNVLRIKADTADFEYSFDVTEEMYLGKIAVSATGFGQLAMFANTWLGGLLFKAIPLVGAVLIAFIEIRIEVIRLLKRIEKKRERKAEEKTDA